jgi:hypothetical protein
MSLRRVTVNGKSEWVSAITMHGSTSRIGRYGHKVFPRHTHSNLLHVSNGPLKISLYAAPSGTFGGMSTAGVPALVVASSRQIEIIFA